jgi:hypothetical protein
MTVASAWTVVRHGLTPTNRRQVEDAAYLLNFEGTPVRAIADELHLDRFATRALIEAGADRDWRRFSGFEPTPASTSTTGLQSPRLGALGRPKPNKAPTRTITPPLECSGCGQPLTGKRRGAKFHNDACRMRAYRMRRAEP